MLPVSPLPRSGLQPHLEPFVRAVAAGVKLMMAAHIKFPQIDSHTVPFSALFLQEIVRQELGFSGVLLSDDLDMAAVSDRPLAEVMVAGLEAGLDMALWGRNLKPDVDPESVCADFCRQMQTYFLDTDCLQQKIVRVRRLREGFLQNG
jgi:beta-N-acetylhexosaminidase